MKGEESRTASSQHLPVDADSSAGPRLTASQAIRALSDVQCFDLTPMQRQAIAWAMDLLDQTRLEPVAPDERTNFNPKPMRNWP